LAATILNVVGNNIARVHSVAFAPEMSGFTAMVIELTRLISPKMQQQLLAMLAQDVTGDALAGFCMLGDHAVTHTHCQ